MFWLVLVITWEESRYEMLVVIRSLKVSVEVNVKGVNDCEGLF